MGSCRSSECCVHCRNCWPQHVQKRFVEAHLSVLICLFVYLSISVLSVCLSVSLCLSIYLFLCYLSVCLSVSVCLSIYFCAICLSVYLSTKHTHPHMYVCVCLCNYVYRSTTHAHTCMFVCLCTCLCMCMGKCMGKCICKCICKCMCKCTHIPALSHPRHQLPYLDWRTQLDCCWESSAGRRKQKHQSDLGALGCRFSHFPVLLHKS